MFDQHELDFTKAFHHATYFYKIPFDQGNFDVGNDFYKGELVSIEDIPNEDSVKVPTRGGFEEGDVDQAIQIE